MIVLLWRVLCIAAAALFSASVIALIFTRLLKNKYYCSFGEDELVKQTKTTNSKNAIYFTSGETRKYIKKYVVCKTAYDRYLVCNYAGKYGEISYFLIQYTRRKRVLSVLKITEKDNREASRVIALNRRCAYVNVIIGTVDGLDINKDVIRPMPLNKIRLYAFLKSFALFFGLFVIRHLIIEFFGGIYMKQYLTDLMNYIAVGGAFVLAVASYFITVKCFRSKNVKALNGGALEYDFL